MKATFFYDIRFLVDDGKYYSHFGVNDEMLSRYLKIFDDFTYVGREESQTEETRKYMNEQYEIKSVKVKTFKQNYKDIKRVIKKEISETDLCIIRLPSMIGLIVQKECKKQQKPYMIEVVGNIFEALWYHSFKTKLFALPLHIITKNVIKKSEYVIYITENYLQKCYPTNGKMFSGVANVSLDKTEENILKKRILQLEQRKENDLIKIGLIGSLDVNYKGHKTAIKAMRIIKKRYPYIELDLLGQGSAARWKVLCKKYDVLDNVVFCGSLPGGKPVMKWLDSIDIYIQPSITEGHGRACVEAMSRGCITFAANTGGLLDSVDLKYVFLKKSYKKLADLIIRAIEDKEFAIQNIKTNLDKSKCYQTDIVEYKRKMAYEELIKEKIQTNEEITFGKNNRI